MELFDFESYHIVAKFLKNRDVIGVPSSCEAMPTSRSMLKLPCARKVSVGSSGNSPEIAMPPPAAMPWTSMNSLHRWLYPVLLPSHQAPPSSRKRQEHGVQPRWPPHVQQEVQATRWLVKWVRKGYEEIHVPSPKQKPVAEGEVVSITALPEWAHSAFTVPSLNRVQSKLFPVAFRTDEPNLLCAPTGAGKVCPLSFGKISVL
jgi:pre-mRNA-splicing helicase BRR2